MPSFVRKLFGKKPKPKPAPKAPAPKAAPVQKPADPVGQPAQRFRSKARPNKTKYTGAMGLSVEQKSGIAVKTLTGA